MRFLSSLASQAKSRIAVLAVGGNALLKPGQQGSVSDQWTNAAALAGTLVTFLKNQQSYHKEISGDNRPFGLVIVNGNGPQVGNLLRQQEALADELTAYPLDCTVAMTQGCLGYQLSRALSNKLQSQGLDMHVSSVITEVLVSGKITPPSKEVGMFYSEAAAIKLQRELGWHMKQDARRGWRHTVPSPRPESIINVQAISSLVEAGHCIVAGGGGGIPVMETAGGDLVGVNAVVDKDYTAALLATQLGAELLIDITNQDKLYSDYAGPGEAPLEDMNTEALKEHYANGEFLPGTMGPKVEAAIEYLSAIPEGRVFVTNIEGLNSQQGTFISGENY